MNSKPPPYDEVGYWDQKYSQKGLPFDWLVPAHLLDDEIKQALSESGQPNPKVLHIGSGSSELSFRLGKLVANPENVYNVDFSIEALEWGKREESLQASERITDEPNPSSPGPRMKWVLASLLSLDSLLKICEPQQYSLIIDKSTSDSVNISNDLAVPIPFPRIVHDMAPTVPTVLIPPVDEQLDVPAIQLLALNLAYLARPGAVWIALSYQASRFDFLQDENSEEDEEEEEEEINSLSEKALALGFPDTKLLWNLEKTVGIETAEEHMEHGTVVHRPTVLHYLFKLRRTDVSLWLPA